jgi:ABC-type antimicrobial peptide transport system permease subunit
VGHLIPDADVLLPARAFDGPMPDTWRVSLPAAKLESLLLAPEWEDIALTLTDHDLRRSEIRSAFDRLRLSLQALGTVIALLTALVIHSLLSADVRERRSEIGLRRSLGARPRDIRNLFLGEAAALGVPAAILGLFPWLVLLPPDRVFSAFALLVLWILGNAAVPALRAAALPPSEALRGA